MVELGKLIKFDPFTKQIIRPTLILETRSGKALGLINYTDLNMSFTAKGLQEISFTTHKAVNGVECEFWDKLRGLAVIRYMIEGEKYIRFEASFSVIDGDETVKSCNAVSLETELGQRTLREFYVNDPNNLQDWLDYDEETGMATPTVLWNENDTAHSLLTRALERVPHWSVGEVSEYFNDGSTVSRADTMQRTFSINGSTVYDFLEGDVCREFGCVFMYDTVNRTINCYNLDDCVWMYSSSPELNGKVAEDITYRNHQFYDKDGNLIDNDNVYIEDSEGTLRKVVYRYCDGIGKDTGILMSKSRLANSFQISEDKDSVKNLFHVTAGDDIMTNLGVAAANATGNTDIVLFDNFVYEDMSEELRNKLLGDGVSEIGYTNYLKEEQKKFYGEPEIVDLITSRSYETNPTDLETANSFYDQYTSGQLQSGLYLGYANSLTKQSFYEHSMSPSTSLSVTTAQEQLNILTTKLATDTLLVTVKPTATAYTTVTSTLSKYFKTYIDTRYDIDIDKESTSYTVNTATEGVWHGKVTITRAIDSTDTVTSGTLNVAVRYVNSSDTTSAGQTAYIEYNKQKILMQIANGDLANLNMVVNGQFISNTELRNLLKQYSLSMLEGFYKGMQECIATLIELKNKLDTIHSASFDLLYAEWQARSAICEEIYNFRQKQVVGWNDIVQKLATEIGMFQSYLDIQRYLADIRQNGNPITIDQMCSIVGVDREKGNQILDKSFAGIDKAVIYDENTGTSIVISLSDYNITVNNNLYKEYCSYLRENEYQNSNYISDGLSDAEILKKGKELIETATKELCKATVLQRSISGDFNNIFAVEELEQLYSSFDLYNYVRCSVDGHIYKLRLMQVSFNEENPESLPVTFAQYIESIDGKMNDVQNILNSAQSISSSYSSTYQQARSGGEAGTIINKIQNEGLNSAEVLIKNSDAEEVIIDNTGIVARSMNDVGAYGNHQLKIIGNGMYLTEDNWETVSMAVGLGLYKKNDSDVGEWKYGVWADLLYGKIILGEQLIIGGDDDNVQIQGDEIIITNRNNETHDYTVCSITTSGNDIFKVTAGVENSYSYDIFNISNTGKLTVRDTLYLSADNFDQYQTQGRIIFNQYNTSDYYTYHDSDLDIDLPELVTSDILGKGILGGDGLIFYSYDNTLGQIDTDYYTIYSTDGIRAHKENDDYNISFSLGIGLNGMHIITDYSSISGDANMLLTVNERGTRMSCMDGFELLGDNWYIYENDAKFPNLHLNTFQNGNTEVGNYLTKGLATFHDSLITITNDRTSDRASFTSKTIDIGLLRIITFRDQINNYQINTGYTYINIDVSLWGISNGTILGMDVNLCTPQEGSRIEAIVYQNDKVVVRFYNTIATTTMWVTGTFIVQLPSDYYDD